jgi:hypothetical protein
MTASGAEQTSAPPGTTLRVSVFDLAPTQTEVGVQAAMRKLDGWRHEARATGLPLAAYLTARAEEVVVNTIIDPDGRHRNDDRHHRILALHWGARRCRTPLGVPVQVLHDYRGWPFAAYASHLVHHQGIGYFGPQPAGRTPVALVRLLPDSYDQLRDNPLRSVVKRAMQQLGLRGEWFARYAQFHVAHRLIEAGLWHELAARAVACRQDALPRDFDEDPRVVATVCEMLALPAIARFLLHLCREPAARRIVRTRARLA